MIKPVFSNAIRVPFPGLRARPLEIDKTR